MQKYKSPQKTHSDHSLAQTIDIFIYLSYFGFVFQAKRL